MKNEIDQEKYKKALLAGVDALKHVKKVCLANFKSFTNVISVIKITDSKGNELDYMQLNKEVAILWGVDFKITRTRFGAKPKCWKDEEDNLFTWAGWIAMEMILPPFRKSFEDLLKSKTATPEIKEMLNYFIERGYKLSKNKKK